MNVPIKADDLFAEWSKGLWGTIYLFAGTEDFLIEQASLKLRDHALPDDVDGLNRDRFDAESHSVSKILDACQTMPFLAGRRFVEVRNVHAFRAADSAKFAEALRTLSPSTTLVLDWGKEWRRDDAKKPLVEAVTQVGKVVIFWPLFPEAAVRWVQQRARHYKKNISTEGAALLVHHTGESLRLLDQEIFKCACFVGERLDIELADLEASFGYAKAASPYEWVSAIRQRKTALATRTMQTLLDDGEEPLLLLAIISRTLRDWLDAKTSNESGMALTMRFRLKKGEENRFRQDLERLTREELVEGLTACVEAEQAIKTGKETPATALTLVTLRLCGFQGVEAFR